MSETKSRQFVRLGIVIGITVLFFAAAWFSANALPITPIKDTISESAPGVLSDHTIEFELFVGATGISDADGNDRIRIIFDDETPNATPDAFAGGIEGGVSAITKDDVDVAIDSGAGFIDYVVGVGCGGGDDFSFVLDSANEEIDLTLCAGGALPGNDISPGEVIQIEIGQNATFGTAGAFQIENPAVSGISYTILIELDDDAVDGNPIDVGETRIMILDPVAVTSKIDVVGPPDRTNGLPDIDLPNGTTSVVMTLSTNHLSFCRYDVVSGTDYFSMPFNFDAVTTTAQHEATLVGLTDGTDYTFYIRCQNQIPLENTDDYIISFSILPSGSNSGGSGSGSGTGNATNSGGGGPGSSGSTGQKFPPVEGAPVITMTGWASRDAKLNILKDGEVIAEGKANIAGEFSIVILEMPAGVNTISISATDLDGRTSRAIAITFQIISGTTTIISNVLVPSTIEMSADTVSPSDVLTVSGSAVPSQPVEIWLSKRGEGDAEVRIAATADMFGRWSAELKVDVSEGAYDVRVRPFVPAKGWGEFSNRLPLGVGQGAPLDTCQRSDINGDGKVNLIDFSILLFHWTTNFPGADINQDGTVSLIDFSIMLFCWTG